MSAITESALAVFHKYLVEPGQMLCFHGPSFDEHRDSLQRLTAEGLVTKDKFEGGYTLTQAGFASIRESHDKRKR